LWKYSLVAAVANLNAQAVLLGKEGKIYKKGGLSPLENTLPLREGEMDREVGLVTNLLTEN